MWSNTRLFRNARLRLLVCFLTALNIRKLLFNEAVSMALNTRLPKAYVYIYTYPLLTVLKLGSLIRATIILGIIYAPSRDGGCF